MDSSELIVILRKIMKNKTNKLIVFFLLLFLTSCSSSVRYEAQIRKILDYKASRGCFTDKQFNKVFEIIENNPQTFKVDFSDSNESDAMLFIGPHKSRIDNMRFVESDDKQVRAYILERYGFQGNPSFGLDTYTLLQYQIGDNIYTFRMPDTYSSIEKIAKLSDNKYLIIAFYGCIAQGEHNYHQARVYMIDERGVHMLSKAFEEDRHLVDEIEVYWEGKISPKDDSDLMYTECFDEYDYEDELYFGLSYNDYDGTLYVANTRISEDDNCKLEVLDGTFKYYCWDGTRFRDVTIMNPYEVKNKDYYIRIEQNKDGGCVYRCWNGGRKVGKPSLTIRNGHREVWSELGFLDYDRWISSDESTILGERYTFVNNGYVYQYMTGLYKGHVYEGLDVYNPNGVLIYSKDFEKVGLDL